MNAVFASMLLRPLSSNSGKTVNISLDAKTQEPMHSLDQHWKQTYEQRKQKRQCTDDQINAREKSLEDEEAQQMLLKNHNYTKLAPRMDHAGHLERQYAFIPPIDYTHRQQQETKLVCEEEPGEPDLSLCEKTEPFNNDITRDTSLTKKIIKDQSKSIVYSLESNVDLINDKVSPLSNGKQPDALVRSVERDINPSLVPESQAAESDADDKEGTTTTAAAVGGLHSSSEAPLSCLEKLKHLMKSLCDISLLKNKLAVVLLLCHLFNFACVHGSMYLPSHAIKMGVSEFKAALLLTVVGGADIVSRVAFGYFTDLGYVRPARIIGSAVFCLGIVCFCSALYTSFGSLLFMAIVYGSFGFLTFSLNTPLIIDWLGIQHLGKMLALTTSLSALSSFVQYQIHGILIEVTGSFVASYHFIGTSFMLGTLGLFSEPLIRRWIGIRREERKRDK